MPATGSGLRSPLRAEVVALRVHRIDEAFASIAAPMADLARAAACGLRVQIDFVIHQARCCTRSGGPGLAAQLSDTTREVAGQPGAQRAAAGAGDDEDVVAVHGMASLHALSDPLTRPSMPRTPRGHPDAAGAVPTRGPAVFRTMVRAQHSCYDFARPVCPARCPGFHPASVKFRPRCPGLEGEGMAATANRAHDIGSEPPGDFSMKRQQSQRVGRSA